MRLTFLLAFMCIVPSFLLGVPPMVVDSNPILPPALKPGDTIAFVAPARDVTDEQMQGAINELESRGYKVTLKYNEPAGYRYLSDTDEVRAEKFNAAFADLEVDAIFPVTGGFGTTRMLDLIDYGVIRANPKIVIGYSDMTGIHLAIWKKTQVVTFHTPFATWMYREREEPRDYSFAASSFWPTLTGSQAQPVIETDELTTPPVVIESGVGQGRLVGGNLSLVQALMGTPYEMDTNGCILFLEDVNEAPYRVDRMLSNLRLAGKLDNLSGVVLGRWRGCEADDLEKEFSLQELFEHYFKGRGYPVVYQFPVGHVIENATFPVGAMVELDADAGTLRLLEPVVTSE